MTAELRVKVGTAICMVGLLIAVVGVLPSVTRPGDFPLLLFVGGFVYLPGAILAFLSAQGRERNKVFWSLRFVRLGFLAVIAFVIFQIMRP